MSGPRRDPFQEGGGPRPPAHINLRPSRCEGTSEYLLDYRAGTGNRCRGIPLRNLGREGGRYSGGALAKEQAKLMVQWVEGGLAGRGRASAGEEEVEGAEPGAQGAELEAVELLG